MESKKKFKKGDYVVLNDATGVHTLEINKPYKIIAIVGNDKNEFISVSEIDATVVYENIKFYNSKRFTTTVKLLRRKKLEKIFNETN